jgi:RNA polymerase sigma-70 factor (ECF subfamily)
LKRPTLRVRSERASGPDRPAAGEDANLLVRVAAGDRGDSLRELYRLYEAPLYAYGLRLLGDAGLAEELVQETFLRVWRSADRFDAARGSVATFIFALARRIAIDLWRRPSSRPFRSTLDPSRVTVNDPAEEVLVGLVVQDGLQALSPAHRQVLELSYRQGLKQSEIAEILDLPLGTVKTRTYYALRALKLALRCGQAVGRRVEGVCRRHGDRHAGR